MFSRSTGVIPTIERDNEGLIYFMYELERISTEMITPFIDKFHVSDESIADGTPQSTITVDFIAWGIGGSVSKSLALYLAVNYDFVMVDTFIGNSFSYTYLHEYIRKY